MNCWSGEPYRPQHGLELRFGDSEPVQWWARCLNMVDSGWTHEVREMGEEDAG